LKLQFLIKRKTRRDIICGFDLLSVTVYLLSGLAGLSSEVVLISGLRASAALAADSLA
jgi:hypothetical protein